MTKRKQRRPKGKPKTERSYEAEFDNREAQDEVVEESAMNLSELLYRSELIQQRGFLFRELFLIVEGRWPRGRDKFITVDGVRRRVRADAVDAVRSVLLRELTSAWGERRELLASVVGETSPLPNFVERDEV